MSTSASPLFRPRSKRALTPSGAPRRLGAPIPVPGLNLPLEPAGIFEIPALSEEHLQLQSRVLSILDTTSQTAAREGHAVFVRELTDAMQSLKASVEPDVWRNVVLPAARVHDFTSLVYECPLTNHSFSQPRGYPGDAGLLDLIYRHDDARPIVDASTETGRSVFDFTINVSACEAVRQRRSLLARTLDDVAAQRPGADMLAVACGHLREAELSTALAGGRVSRFVATDQDEDSLDVAELYAGTVSSSIETRKLSVRDYITAKHGLGSFDLVYAAGLYDYLDDRIASRLTRKLFALLKPGGRLLVANFRTGIWEAPFMEAYMDWHLLYRSEAQIRAFADEISEIDVAQRRYFEDDTACIGYLELERA